MHFYICSRGDFGIIQFKLRNFAVVERDFFATVDRGSKMTRIHIWSITTYGSLQTNLMEANHNGHIHRYGMPIFGNIVVYALKNMEYFAFRRFFCIFVECAGCFCT